MSAVELDARAAGRHIQIDEQNLSVGESYIDDEPILHDLFEIGRFSFEMSKETTTKLKRREVRKEEDLNDTLSILCHQRASTEYNTKNDELSLIVTMWP